MNPCPVLKSGAECPNGCIKGTRVCHGWAQQKCADQTAAWCSEGVHFLPGPQVKRKRSVSEDFVIGSSAGQAADSSTGTRDEAIATKALLNMLSRGGRSPSDLMRLLEALHPDKVKNTVFEKVFNALTVEIIQLKKSAEG